MRAIYKGFVIFVQAWGSFRALKETLVSEQDLVEVLTTKGIWKIPRKHDQAAYARNANGSFAGFEDDPPFL